MVDGVVEGEIEGFGWVGQVEHNTHSNYHSFAKTCSDRYCYDLLGNIHLLAGPPASPGGGPLVV